MKEAYCEKLKRTVKVNEVTEEMRKNKTLICKTKGCNARLTWVKSHKKISGIEYIFFRLLNNKEKKEQHASFCKFNTKGRINTIVASSDSDILESIDNEQYELRLNLLCEALNKLEDEDDNPEVTDDVPKDPRDKNFKRIGKLKTYLSTMNKVMQLRSEVENDEELRHHIKLIFNDKKVTWDNFYYENDEFERVYNYISKSGIGVDKITIHHPICVQGEVIEFEDLKPKGYNFYSIKLKSTTLNEGNKRYTTTLKLSTNNKKIIKIINEYYSNYSHYPEIAAYFIPSIKKVGQPFKTGSIEIYYKNIIGRLNRIDQITLIDED